MKCFEFGQQNETLMVLLHGGGVCYQGALSHGCRVLLGVLADCFREAYRVTKPGGIFCGCFFIKGENKRTDWFIEKLYTSKGFFTPPYETADNLTARLESLYSQMTVNTVESIGCFTCVKGE